MKSMVLNGASAMALALAGLAATPANANDGQAFALEEIVVTATRRALNLQEVPQSITAFSARQIEVQGITEIADFAIVTPGITVVQGFFGGDTPAIVFRGLGALAGAAPSVGLLVDGVNLPAGEPLRNRMFDLERIEVVKGPQAALYGRDTIGGVINVITRQPTNELEGRFNASYGSADTYTVDGAISGPLVEDRLLARISASHLKSDGFFRNFGGFRQDYREESSFRGQLKWLASEDVSITLYSGYLDVHNGYNAAFFNFDSDDRYIQDNDNLLDSEEPGFNKRTNWDTALKVEADLGFAEMTSITQYQKIRGKLALDGDFGLIRLGGMELPPFTGLKVNSDLKTRDFSQDMRLVSPTEHSFRWIAGAFFASQRRDLELGTDLFIGDFLVPTPPVVSEFKDTNWSIYGQLEYDLTDALTVSGALRYSEDKHHHSDVPNALKEDVITPQVIVKYQVTSDLMMFGSYAQGYRSGGFDVNTGHPYLSEKTKNWEVGVKSAWFDNRLTANVSAYHISYTDQQITTIVTLPSGALGGGTANVGDTRLKGVEVEVNAVPARNLTLSATATFADSNVRTGEDAFVGYPLPYNIPFKSSLAGQYVFDLGDELQLMTRGEWVYFDGQHWGTSISPGTGLRRVLEQSAYSRVNLRAMLTFQGFTLAGDVQNLFNTKYNDQLYPDLAAGGWHATYPGLPRRYTVELGVRF
ncbi:MAG: TonB-dependent receptor [Sphingomonadales bacterium]|nr:TonB-dependent receptor [Sphingomonadales bacterium]